MTAESIDPKSFKDWEEAFQHPIVSVRKFEQSLRSHAEENSRKLRTIVGASYRDLLGTADRIIQMNEQVKVVEKGLGAAGTRCSSKNVERIFASTAAFDTHLLSKKKSQLEIASQLATLRNCATIVSRLLKRGGSTLVAAKILTLARLTHEILSQVEPESSLIESLKRKLSSLYESLRRAIDVQLSDPNAESIALVQHLCAFSLITRATTKDILRHFHEVRLKAIEDCLAGKSPTNEDATKAVHLLVGTLHVSQQIFPKRLIETLSKLKQKPLLQHSDVRSVVELDLDLHEQWIPEQLRNYTVWQRQEELQKADVDKVLKSWARSAVKSFCTGLRSNLQRMDSFQEIITLRKHVFQIWPWSGKKLPGLDYTEVADELREIINERLGQLLTVCAGKLKNVLDSVSTSLTGATEEQISSLWDTDFTTKDLSNGATGYKTKIKTIYRGEDDASRKSIDSYKKWTEQVFELATAINQMRTDRWDDDLEDDEDEVDTDSKQILLSSDDPRDLERVFVKSLESSFKSLQKGLEGVIDSLAVEQDNMLPRRVACLRILRELLGLSIGQGFRTKVDLKLQLEDKKLLDLQEKIASHAALKSTELYQLNLQKFSSSKLLGRILWQGTPALPVQPSPSSYRYLQSVTTEMASLGPDLWASGTVSVLKRHASDLVTPILEEACKEIMKPKETPVVNGDKEKSEESNETMNEENNETEDKEMETKDEESPESNDGDEKLIQLLFDAAYIQSALDSKSVFADLIKSIGKRLDLKESEVSRLERSAFEYWKRTYLMFALLSV